MFCSDSSIPFSRWDRERIVAWLNEIGLNMYLSECRRWVRNGEHLLKASPHDIEKVIILIIIYSRNCPIQFALMKTFNRFSYCMEFRRILSYCTELRRHVHSRTSFARSQTWRKNLVAIFFAISVERQVKLQSWQTLSQSKCRKNHQKKPTFHLE